MAEQRKLAAILAADVVGFSRLAGADEDRTLARLRALRSDLMDPTIAVHRGRVVKRMGDGALVEFRSVVDAVRCAIEVQTAMIERNAGLSPEHRIELRIGIHLGDVVEESDGDLMGDGVNIAARIEGVAAPGAICLSEDAYRQVRRRARPRAAAGLYDQRNLRRFRHSPIDRRALERSARPGGTAGMNSRGLCPLRAFSTSKFVPGHYRINPPIRRGSGPNRPDVTSKVVFKWKTEAGGVTFSPTDAPGRAGRDEQRMHG